MALHLHNGLVMKKSTSKLALRTQTIRLLTSEALDHIVGGVAGEPAAPGFIMRDTIIIKTSGIVAPADGGR